jgi:DNA helicase II / ATP-dependent DNA helicase PcrA
LPMPKISKSKTADGWDWVGTFHSIGARIIRRYARYVGLNSNFSILDRPDSVGLLASIADEFPVTVRQSFPDAEDCLRIYSIWINGQDDLGEILKKRFPAQKHSKKQLLELFVRYEAGKLMINSADFDDLLRLLLTLLQHGRIGPKISGQFEHVLIDEYQDTSRLQAQILRAIKPSGRGLFVVGDDAQCIYTFRGASIENIVDFPRDFSPVAKIIKLRRNYRSPTPIVSLYNLINCQSLQGMPKKLVAIRSSKQLPRIEILEDKEAEAKRIVKLVQRRRERGVPLRDQVVLFREYAHCQHIVRELRRRQVPFEITGTSRLLETDTRDVLMIVRWGLNIRDRQAALRVLQKLPQMTATQALSAYTAASSSGSFKEVAKVLPESARASWRNVRAVLVNVQNGSSDAGETIAAGRKWLLSTKRNGKLSVRTDRALDALAKLATAKLSCRRLIDDCTITPDIDLAPSTDRLALSSVHRAKGKEWPYVMIVGAIDNNLPSRHAKTPADYEEERRLFGVAVSRAKRNLRIMYPRQSHKEIFGGRRFMHRLTPFISRESLPYFRVITPRQRRV